MTETKNMREAKNHKCHYCEKQQAVAWYPDMMDFEQFPYCRKCLDALKTKLMMEIFSIK